MRNANIATTSRARELRQRPSNAERLLWGALRGRRLAAYKFVRQEPIGPFFADFLCRTHMLIVEVDDATHSTEEQISYDRRRAAFLRKLGYVLSASETWISTKIWKASSKKFSRL